MCSAPVAGSSFVNGTCGSANGAVRASAPTTGLCGAGVASSVSGSGPWSWTCAGSNGGTTASCSAPASGGGGVSPLFVVDMNPPNGSSSQTGTAGLTTNDGLFTIAGPWTASGSNEMTPSLAVFTTTDPSGQGEAATGFLALTVGAGTPLTGSEIASNALPGYGYGYYEVRMMVDASHVANGGCVSFFWIAAGGTQAHKTYGPLEYDIEFLASEPWATSTSNTSGSVWFTTHPNGVSHKQTLSFNPSRGYHRYGFLWVPGTLSFTADGQVIYTVSNSDVATAPSQGGWIMANAWSGISSWGGGPPASNQTSYYDWFKFWPDVTSVPDP
jgi:hypothetical protein